MTVRNILLSLLGAACLVCIIMFFIPSGRTSLRIEGTAPPGMCIEVKTTFGSESQTRGHTPKESSSVAVAIAVADADGKFSLVAEVGNKAAGSFDSLFGKKPRGASTSLYLSMPSTAPHLENLIKTPSSTQVAGVEAATLWLSESPKDSTAELTCTPTTGKRSVAQIEWAWDCKPRSGWGNYSDSYIGDIQVYPKADPFVLHIKTEAFRVSP